MRVALSSGAYQARSIIANAQRCINLYAEKNTSDSPTPITYYPTPGLTLLQSPPVSGIARGDYRSSNGNLYSVVGSNVYAVSSTWVHTLLGTISTTTSMISFSDNSLVIMLVDGSSIGYAINMLSNAFGVITDPNFLGANKVDYIDTFFVLNLPNTLEFYSSLGEVSYPMLTSPLGAIVVGDITSPGSAYTNGTYTNISLIGGNGTGATANIVVMGNEVTSVTLISEGIKYEVGDVLTATGLGFGTGFAYTVGTIGGSAFFNLDIAAKSGSPDPLVSLIVLLQEIWLVGQLTSEIWFNAGDAPFPFEQMPQGFIEHGITALYSLVKQDTSCYWLSQDKQGRNIVLKGSGYLAKRISTHAIENTFATYSTVSDAVGYNFQIEGHEFFVLTFPTANATWMFDESTEEWSELAWTDNNGILNRHRAQTAAFAYGVNVCRDWENGNLYQFDINNYTDNGQPISRIRSFAHTIDDGNRLIYNSFIADIQVGQGGDSTSPPQVFLRWSDDRGETFGNAIGRSMGAIGKYLELPKWWRLGLARDRIFELSWSSPQKTALNGAFIEVQKVAT